MTWRPGAGPGEADAGSGPAWRPTRALRRGVAMAALPLVFATVLGQPELVLLAVPFALGTALSLRHRPTRVPEPSLSLDQPASVEGGAANARVRVRNDDAVPLLSVVSTSVSSWIRLRHGTGQHATMLSAEATTTVRLTGTAVRWGPQHVGPATVRVFAGDGLLATQRSVLPAAPLAVYPVEDAFWSRETLPRAAGMSGIHHSRRPGQSGELADVRAFQPGDRLRRINWRVTRRTGEVHVNATLSDRDAEVMLVLDARHEAGRSEGVAGAASVLDATVRAAAAIAGHYTHQGDRVGLVEVGPRLRRLRPGTGRRHHLAVLEWLVGLNRLPTGFSAGVHLLHRILHRPGALVVVLTPLLDADSAHLLAFLARSGRAMVAVDTLPDGVRPPYEDEWSFAGERLWRLERTNTLERLRERGVPVARWEGPGSLDAMLRHVYRLSTTSRVMAR